MTDIDKQYDSGAVETTWRSAWKDSPLYEYRDSGDTAYIIDTPPPYPTGNLHVGNALGWCYMDFAARYHRLQGHDVLFPQGWDCHGLPTEVKVEENNDIHRTDVKRSRFREMCVAHTEEQIEAMRETMSLLGFSQDWEHEYRTMDPEYWGKTQQSFLEMAESGYVYRDEHPVNWCPRCQTAIADAEVENENRTGKLYRIRFDGVDNPDIEISTTRLELLPACGLIAVDPDDERYEGRIGESFEVPLFDHEIELVADEAVDPEFGSGAVMICTFGDKMDVEWWTKYDIELREVVSEDGRLTTEAGEFEGLPISEAKDSIASALVENGHIINQTPKEQSIGVCWRCDTSIEILTKEQWFISINKEEILEEARKVNWIPDHMYSRFKDWTDAIEWDWVVSRQRVFATPIPAWFCENCGYSHLASIEETPVDPTDEAPSIDNCPECGVDDWRGETDVMDTWMDSSISALHVAGWPDSEFEPLQLREQGHDIIRTWAFYTVLRTSALVDETPWEDALINGMVLGSDGRKMSKSRGNFVQPEEVVEEYGADAFRQALALGGSPGSDVQVGMDDAKTESQFLTKLWNILRFADSHLDGSHDSLDQEQLTDVDLWILTAFDEVLDSMSEHLADYRFDQALRVLKNFVWHDFADNYLELVKGRLYEEDESSARGSGIYTLYTVISGITRTFSIYAPFFTEEAWHQLPGHEESVHRQSWPGIDHHDEAARNRGELVVEITSAVRSWKSDKGLSLNAPLKRIGVYGLESLEIDTSDLANAVNSNVSLYTSAPEYKRVPVEVVSDFGILGPKFGADVEKIVERIESFSLEELEENLSNETISIEDANETFEVPTEAFELRYEFRGESGQQLDILELDDVTVVVTSG